MRHHRYARCSPRRPGANLASERPSLFFPLMLPWKFYHMSRTWSSNVKDPKRPDSVPSQNCFSCPSRSTTYLSLPRLLCGASNAFLIESCTPSLVCPDSLDPTFKVLLVLCGSDVPFATPNEWMSFNSHLEKSVWSTRIGRNAPI